MSLMFETASSTFLTTWVSISSGAAPSYTWVTSTMGSLMSGKRSTYIRLYAMTPSTTNTRTSIMVVTGLVMKSLMMFTEGYPCGAGCAKLTLAPSSSLENPLVTTRSSGPTPPVIRTKSSFMPEISTVVRLTVSFLTT